MPAARRVTVELDEKAAALVDRKLLTGEFANDADVVRQAVDDMLLNELFDALPLPTEAELDQAIREGVAAYLADPDGGQDLDEAFEELEAEWAERDRLR